MVETIIKKQHEFQNLFLQYTRNPVIRAVAFFGGLQSGKSVAGADGLEDLLYGPNCIKLPEQAKGQIPEVWILSKSYVLAQAALNTFRWRSGHCFMSDKICRELGLKRGDQNSYWLKPSMRGDCAPIMLRVRTAHDPEALRATPVLLAAWCDEMAHWPEMAWLNLQGRGIVTRTKYLITTTPKGKNWLYYDVCIPGEAKPGDPLHDETIRTVKCRSVDNPWADRKYIASLRKKFGENYAQQELDGLFISSSGLVYPAFDKQKHLRHLPSHDPAHYPVRIIGADPGYGDPYACVVLLRDSERKWWIAEEFYQQNAITSDIIPWFKSAALKWNIQRTFVDKRRPADAEELRKHNVKAVANYELYAENDRRTILPMVRVVEAIFREDRIGGISPDCEWTIDEFENYSYPDREARNKGENPVDWKNHCMDAIRYGIVSIEGVNYEGPGQIFRSGKKGEFIGGKKSYRPIPKQPRSLGQAILDQEKSDESTKPVRRF